jgi:hypothetical protein
LWLAFWTDDDDDDNDDDDDDNDDDNDDNGGLFVSGDGDNANIGVVFVINNNATAVPKLHLHRRPGIFLAGQRRGSECIDGLVHLMFQTWTCRSSNPITLRRSFEFYVATRFLLRPGSCANHLRVDSRVGEDNLTRP